MANQRSASKKIVSGYFEEEVKERIRELAEKRGETMTDLLDKWIVEGLDRDEKKKVSKRVKKIASMLIVSFILASSVMGQNAPVIGIMKGKDGKLQSFHQDQSPQLTKRDLIAAHKWPDIITGKVVEVQGSEVFLNLGRKQEGVVFSNGQGSAVDANQNAITGGVWVKGIPDVGKLNKGDVVSAFVRPYEKPEEYSSEQPAFVFVPKDS